MSSHTLPPDINRLIANLPNMTIGDIHSLCRSHRSFNESVCRQNEHLKNILREAREKLTDYYAVIKSKTPSELESDLKSLSEQPNIYEFVEKGYEKAVWSHIDEPCYHQWVLINLIVKYGRDEIIDELLENEPDLFTTIILAAARAGREDLV